MFAPKFFNIEIIFALSILIIVLSLRFSNRFPVSIFFRCAMPRQDPADDIQRLADQVEDVAVIFSVRLWGRGHNGSLWFNFSEFINILTGSGNINTNNLTPDVEVAPVIMYRSGRLLEMGNGWLTSGVCTIHCVIPDTFTKWSCRSS